MCSLITAGNTTGCHIPSSILRRSTLPRGSHLTVKTAAKLNALYIKFGTLLEVQVQAFQKFVARKFCDAVFLKGSLKEIHFVTTVEHSEIRTVTTNDNNSNNIPKFQRKTVANFSYFIDYALKRKLSPPPVHCRQPWGHKYATCMLQTTKEL